MVQTCVLRLLAQRRQSFGLSAVAHFCMLYTGVGALISTLECGMMKLELLAIPCCFLWDTCCDAILAFVGSEDVDAQELRKVQCMREFPLLSPITSCSTFSSSSSTTIIRILELDVSTTCGITLSQDASTFTYQG